MAPVRNTPVQSRGGWKQEKVRPSRECFFLTSQSIEHSHSTGGGFYIDTTFKLLP
jgi:hypothetical protein